MYIFSVCEERKKQLSEVTTKLTVGACLLWSSGLPNLDFFFFFLSSFLCKVFLFVFPSNLKRICFLVITSTQNFCIPWGRKSC